jgi:uncharacterized membrane protein YedE/YeeE
MDTSSWIAAFVGGMMIGTAALTLYALSGRIAGISGIAYGLLSGTGEHRSWRWLFVLALLAGGGIAAALFGQIAAPAFSAPVALQMIGAGLLVGIGTRLGNGCTSGHGVCGLARLSPRSLAATLTFMAAGMLVATALHHFW